MNSLRVRLRPANGRTLFFGTILLMAFSILMRPVPSFASVTPIENPTPEYLAGTTKLDISSFTYYQAFDRLADGNVEVMLDKTYHKYHHEGYGWSDWGDAGEVESLKPAFFGAPAMIPGTASFQFDRNLSSFGVEIGAWGVDTPLVTTVTLKRGGVAVGSVTRTLSWTFADSSRKSKLFAITSTVPFDRAEVVFVGSNNALFSQLRYSLASVSDSLTGRSKWQYRDLADTAAKYEGGYAAFDNTEYAGDYDNPHGGYDTATNKCKVCHAVHRAEGAYYLLRADSQDDACDYCHIGGSAHSSKVVYDLNSAGKATTNGHTIGASTYIPDSTVAQWTEAVTLNTVDENGAPLSEDIEVRAYDEQKNDMYRFARHHGHSAATGAARRNYVPVGPLALRCMSCHQVHNAEAQEWITLADVGNAGEYIGTTVSSYKLLKQWPSGTFIGSVDSYTTTLGNISLVPETTLTAGVNFDAVRAMGADPTALNQRRDYNNDGDMADSGENVAFNKPMWVAQTFDGEHDPAEYLAEQSIASAVNRYALSVWCADCHNLNIGGWEHLTNPELGFKAHTERTHPAPFTGAHSGPGQCYSCHRNDLPRINTGDTCSQCHYGTGNYRENRTESEAELVASDFPHSGEDGDYKMLGSYSVLRTATDSTTNTTIDDTVVVGADNLDAVCIRCHGGIGTFH